MDQIDDPIRPKAARANGAAAVGKTESTGATEADSPTTEHPPGSSAGIRPGFLSELAIAMRATAEREREHIATQVADEAATHVEKVRARASVETDELRRMAEEDVQHIEEWSATEMDRIRAEADTRIEDRRASLEEYLKQHDSIIENEIQGVDAAVRDYASTLDRFFLELSETGDPAAIVARAEALPAPPDLDQVRAQARASAVAMFASEDDEEPRAQPAAVMAAGASSVAGEGIAEVTEAAAAPIGDDGSNGSMDAETTGQAETVVAAAVDDTTELAGAAEPTEVAAAAEPTPAPVPVMDPAATANTTWPAAGADAPEEPVEISPTVDNTSAAVRLLRSVAPWTAPTHAGSSDRGPDDPD